MGELTVQDVLDLNAYWERHPPIPEILCAGLHVAMEKKQPPGKPMGRAELEAMARVLNRGGGKQVAGKAPPWLKTNST